MDSNCWILVYNVCLSFSTINPMAFRSILSMVDNVRPFCPVTCNSVVRMPPLESATQLNVEDDVDNEPMDLDVESIDGEDAGDEDHSEDVIDLVGEEDDQENVPMDLDGEEDVVVEEDTTEVGEGDAIDPVDENGDVCMVVVEDTTEVVCFATSATEIDDDDDAEMKGDFPPAINSLAVCFFPLLC